MTLVNLASPSTDNAKLVSHGTTLATGRSGFHPGSDPPSRRSRLRRLAWSACAARWRMRATARWASASTVPSRPGTSPRSPPPPSAASFSAGRKPESRTPVGPVSFRKERGLDRPPHAADYRPGTLMPALQVWWDVRHTRLPPRQRGISGPSCTGRSARPGCRASLPG